MRSLRYLIDYAAPLQVLLGLLLGQDVLRPLNPLELGAHVLVLLDQLLLVQLVQAFVYQ